MHGENNIKFEILKFASKLDSEDGSKKKKKNEKKPVMKN
jgi:hypothetical protein